GQISLQCEARTHNGIRASSRTDHATPRPSDHPLEHRGRRPTQSIWGGLAQDRPPASRMHDGRACGARGNAPCIQNLDSLLPYLVAIFAVTFFSTYVAQSSDWLNYAGPNRHHVSDLLCRSGAIFRHLPALWRFWGIVLGVLTTGFVFLFLWP